MEDRVITKKELENYNKVLENELVKFLNALLPVLVELRKNTEHMGELVNALRDDMQNATAEGGSPQK